jgi:hypothetical protein
MSERLLDVYSAQAVVRRNERDIRLAIEGWLGGLLAENRRSRHSVRGRAGDGPKCETPAQSMLRSR